MKNTPLKFWARVNILGPDDCWEWQGAISSGGYGSLSYRGISAVAHRVAYFLAGGGVPITAPKDKSLSGFILHSCDNKICCNPKHLHLGTYSCNQVEAYARNLRVQPKGEAHPNSKLSSAQAARVRELYNMGATQVDISRQFGVSQVAISLIVRRKTYK